VITQFPLPASASHPWGITAGPDGNLWFAQVIANRIGRITTAGVVTEFPVPTPSSRPRGITSGLDGNLWFTEANADQIGRITPDGEITEFPVSSKAFEIAAGSDGAVWFTRVGATLGRITTSGEVTEFPLPEHAFAITAGPDGNIWLGGAGKIWRLSLRPADVTDVRFLPVVGSTPGAGGSFFRTAVQIHNPTSQGMAGQIVFRRSGGSSSSGRLHYLLNPGQTLSIPDLLPAMGLSGVGSADIETTFGTVPVVTARVFNDAGAAGTWGFTEEPRREDEALSPERPGVLVLPADLTAFRFNVGVRTLADGATVTLTLRDRSGTIVTTASRIFPATYHEQQSVNAFLGLTLPLPAGGSISISFDSGSAFFYGAAVDNVTGDPFLQMARPTR
jgi:hypothetical protein